MYCMAFTHKAPEPPVSCDVLGPGVAASQRLSGRRQDSLSPQPTTTSYPPPPRIPPSNRSSPLLSSSVDFNSKIGFVLSQS